MAPARTQHAATPVPVIFTRGIFTYDGDGKRVKSVESTSVGTTTTYFVGGHFELTGAESTKYYFAGSTRIAIPKDIGTMCARERLSTTCSETISAPLAMEFI